MRWSFGSVTLTAGLLLGCTGSTEVDGTAKGTWNGEAVDVSFHADSHGFGGIDEGTLGNDRPDRDIAPGIADVGSLPDHSTVEGKTGSDSPTHVELRFHVPPPIIYAGPWKPPSAEFSFRNDADEDLLVLDAGHGLVLEFDEPEFSDSGEVTMVQTGRLAGAAGKSGELAFDGTFRLQYECTLQNTYFRHCGNARQGDGKANPNHRPYAENTCPKELVAPYEASPTWDGTTLVLGDRRIDCRETESHGDTTLGANLLCYERRTGVDAGGCSWTVHFLTDGAVQQFAIAAFAEASCATKTCNTYR